MTPHTYPKDPVTGELLPVRDPHVYHSDERFQGWMCEVLTDFFAGLMEDELDAICGPMPEIPGADLLSSNPLAATHGAADTSPTAATVHPGAAALTRGGLAPQAPTASPLEVA